jgi:hypothetical protein
MCRHRGLSGVSPRGSRQLGTGRGQQILAGPSPRSATVAFIRAYCRSMERRRNRETFAALLRDLRSPDSSVSLDVVLVDPKGLPISSPPTHRPAKSRPWMKVADLPVGLLPCGAAIAWTSDTDRGRDFSDQSAMPRECQPGFKLRPAQPRRLTAPMSSTRW